MKRTDNDPDANKGVVEETDPRKAKTPTTLRGQLPHRTENPLIKSNDSDYPEQGENPEHSGEPEKDGLTRDYRKPA